MSTKPDALLNLADAMAEDIFNTPDDEVLREVEEDCGDPCGLANKFDQILERAEKQVFGTARSAASPQVRLSVLDLPYRLREWCSTLFGSGPGRSGRQFQLFSVNRMVWAGAAAVLMVLILAPAVFRSMSGGQLPIQTAQTGQPTTPYGPTTPYFAEPPGPPSSSQVVTDITEQERMAERLAVRSGSTPVAAPPLPSSQAVTDITEQERIATGLAPSATALVQEASSATQPPTAESAQRKLTDKEIEILLARGRKLIRSGNIFDARLALKWAAEAGNATATLELGATYDPLILREIQEKKPSRQVVNSVGVNSVAVAIPPTVADIAMAKAWYEKARDLGSAEAAVRLKRLTSDQSQRR